jgi:hypothetical protein
MIRLIRRWLGIEADSKYVLRLGSNMVEWINKIKEEQRNIQEDIDSLGKTLGRYSKVLVALEDQLGLERIYSMEDDPAYGPPEPRPQMLVVKYEKKKK